MPIACTRCGASEDGEILTAPIAFAFVHDKGCGHGIGPLAVVKGKTPKKEPKKEKVKKLKKGEVPWEKSVANTENLASTDTTATTESTEPVTKAETAN